MAKKKTTRKNRKEILPDIGKRMSLNRFFAEQRDMINDEMEAVIPDVMEDVLQNPTGSYQRATNRIIYRLDTINKNTKETNKNVTYIKNYIDKDLKKALNNLSNDIQNSGGSGLLDGAIGAGAGLLSSLGGGLKNLFKTGVRSAKPLAIPALGGLLAHYADQDTSKAGNSTVGSWINENIPGAAAIDDFTYRMTGGWVGTDINDPRYSWNQKKKSGDIAAQTFNQITGSDAQNPDDVNVKGRNISFKGETITFDAANFEFLYKGQAIGSGSSTQAGQAVAPMLGGMNGAVGGGAVGGAVGGSVGGGISAGPAGMSFGPNATPNASSAPGAPAPGTPMSARSSSGPAGQAGAPTATYNAPVIGTGTRAGLNENSTLVDATSTSTVAALGIDQRQYNAFRQSLANIESSGGTYNITGGAGGNYTGAYQFGGPAMQDAAKALGIPVPTREEFMKNPQLQEQFLDAYTALNHKTLMRVSPEYAAMTPEQQLGVLGYAHNQGAGGAAKWLKTGQAGSDAFGTSGTTYTSAIANQLERTKNAGMGGSAPNQTFDPSTGQTNTSTYGSTLSPQNAALASGQIPGTSGQTYSPSQGSPLTGDPNTVIDANSPIWDTLNPDLAKYKDEILGGAGGGRTGKISLGALQAADAVFKQAANEGVKMRVATGGGSNSHSENHGAIGSGIGESLDIKPINGWQPGQAERYAITAGKAGANRIGVPTNESGLHVQKSVPTQMGGSGRPDMSWGYGPGAGNYGKGSDFRKQWISGEIRKPDIMPNQTATAIPQQTQKPAGPGYGPTQAPNSPAEGVASPLQAQAQQNIVPTQVPQVQAVPTPAPAPTRVVQPMLSEPPAVAQLSGQLESMMNTLMAKSSPQIQPTQPSINVLPHQNRSAMPLAAIRQNAQALGLSLPSIGGDNVFGAAALTLAGETGLLQ